MRRLTRVVFAAVAFGSVLVSAAPIASPVFTGRPLVKDGDDLCFGAVDVRLLGVDAFETQQQCRNATGQPYACGVEGAIKLRSLVSKGIVTCEERWGRDGYGRPLVACSVGTLDINEEMVRSGWAVAYKRSLKKYRDAQREAEDAKRGVWAFGRGSFELPWVWRETHQATNPSCAE